MKDMKNRLFSIAIGALACGVLALPALAQDNSQSSLAQWLYEAIASWLGGLPIEEPEVSPHIPPGGLTAAGNASETAPQVPPGAVQTPGDPTNAAPYNMPGGRSFMDGDGGGEFTPHIPPGG